MALWVVWYLCIINTVGIVFGIYGYGSAKEWWL